MIEFIQAEIRESIDAKQQVLKSKGLITQIRSLVNKCVNSLKNGGKIIFCGNGGSFADSQHLAAEFVSRLRFDRPPVASIALGTNNSNFSAIANDYGFEQVFSREILALGEENDIFIPISTSGKSLNILDAIRVAKVKDIETFGFSGGTGGEMAIYDVIVIPSNSTEKIQEVHIMLGHILCAMVEKFYLRNDNTGINNCKVYFI